MLAIAAVALVCSGPGDREWTVQNGTISTQLRAEKSVGRLIDEKRLPDGRRWRAQFAGGAATFTLAGKDYVLTFDNGVTTRGTCVSR
jgi:hypothetical protein